MDHPDPLDLTLQLPRDLYWHIVHTLRGSLPLLPPNATQDDEARRDNAAIARVASMLPANAHEATLAAQFVAADAHAHDSMRLAHQYPNDPKLILQCTAQSANMFRQSRGALSLLLRVQAIRQKREADSAALDKAAWTEHCAIGLMAGALGRRNAPIPDPAPPAPPAEPEPSPEDTFATLSEADQYAILYPRRAALIRQHGGLPPSYDFGPPEPDLERAIATGTSPILRALDAQAGVTVQA